MGLNQYKELKSLAAMRDNYILKNLYIIKEMCFHLTTTISTEVR